MGLGIGADADVGFAWSGGGDGAGADRAQGATGSSTTDRKICSTVSASMSSTLSRFSGCRSRSLSLGEGLPDSRDGTRADGVGSRAAPAFFFLVFCLAAPSSYRVDRGRHLAASTFGGVDQCRALSPDFPAAARGLYPLARGCRIRGMAPALMVWDRGQRRLFSF